MESVSTHFNHLFHHWSTVASTIVRWRHNYYPQPPQMPPPPQ